MSEERFTGKLLTNSNGEEFGFTIYDEDKRMSIDEVIGVLNEQQATIEQLKSELNDCEKFRYQVFKRIGELSDE